MAKLQSPVTSHESAGLATIAKAPPYYAVLFSSKRKWQQPGVDDGYGSKADEIEARAKDAEGYLGIESVRDENQDGMTVSYWEAPNHIRQWRADLQHRAAQALGKSQWYESYGVNVARVEVTYGSHAPGVIEKAPASEEGNQTGESPHGYVVIFSSLRQGSNPAYDTMMERLQSKGKTIREGEVCIAFSTWTNHADIEAWKSNPEAAFVEKLGNIEGCRDWNVRIAKIERQYSNPPL